MHRRGRVVLIWAVTATVATVVFANIALFLFVKLRGANAQLAQATTQTRRPAASRRSAPNAASPFASLQDSDVAGRYHLFQEGTDVGIVTLLTNHSIINKDGTTFPQYHWEIQPGGLMTMWQRGRIFFDVMVQPGVYVSRAKDGSDYRRIEKVEE
jgi:hypothetical protein